MAFARGIALIEQVNDLEMTYRRIEDEGEEYYEADELEILEDQAYRAYWNALEALANYLSHAVVGISKQAAWTMAREKRNEIYDLFSRAK